MKFYCGIDLSASDCFICVIDQNQATLLHQKVANDLSLIVALLEPFKPHLKIVVESTFNWYWLIDGLDDAGFSVCLAHRLGLSMITGAKVKTDRRDAFTLAKLLLAGVIPPAYIYPRETRPVRDLLRCRLQVVQLRAREYGSLRQLLLRQGIVSSSRNQIKRTDEQELAEMLSHPLVVLNASQQLERISLLTKQIAELEQAVVDLTKDQLGYKRLLRVAGIGKILALTIL